MITSTRNIQNFIFFLLDTWRPGRFRKSVSSLGLSDSAIFSVYIDIAITIACWRIISPAVVLIGQSVARALKNNRSETEKAAQNTTLIIFFTWQTCCLQCANGGA